MADPKAYDPGEYVEVKIPQSGTFHHNYFLKPGPIRIPFNPNFMSRRISRTENLYIQQAANGYIVHLPDNYMEDLQYQSPDLRDNITKLFTLGNIALIMKIMQRIKNGEEYADLIPAETQPADKGAAMCGMQDGKPSYPENRTYTFPTWESASAFIKQFYEN